MGFLNEVKTPNTTTSSSVKSRTGGFLGNVVQPTSPQRGRQIFSLQQQADQSIKEAERLNSVKGITAETGKEIFRRLFSPIKNIATQTFEQQKELIPKIKEDVAEGARDIQEGNRVKGAFKSGGRVAGDTLLTIFAPINAVLGEALRLSGGQKIIDKTGEVIADKSGITDVEKFQEFAVNHPNAGEDFERLMFLFLARKDTSRIDPRQAVTETRAFVNKLVQSETKAAPPKPTTEGGFLDTVQSEAQPLARVEGEAVAPRVPAVEGQGLGEALPATKVSKVAKSIEENTIKEKLSESFDGLAGFDPITVRGQASLADTLIKTDIAKARRIASGEEALPSNLRASSLIVALEEHAIRKGDAQLLRDLASSKLVSETSRHAQELRLLAERSPDSPVKVIQDISKAREDFLQKRTKQTPKQIKVEETQNIKNSITKSASSRPTWEQFINELKCN